ncbi:MAG: hypothetical protein EVB11_00525 [Winogradskyella sp.]|nr:MAG: hypothetical protein EVB11_00525 [Winogradskyella sp.]
MTKRDFFRVLIKIFALYSIILTVFSWVPTNLMYSFFDYENIVIIAIALLATFLSILIYVFLIKKTDAIIDFLKIDKGFDDSEIELSNFNSEKVLMLGIILISGFLIVSEFSNFIEYSFLAFKTEIQRGNINYFIDNSFGSSKDYFDWIFSGINLLIGCLLLTNYYKISKWIIKKGKT